MKFRIIKKCISLSVVSTWLGAIVLFVGHGCGKVGDSRGSATLSSIVDTSAVQDITIYPNTKTVSTVYAKQFLDNMVSCTGLEIESSRTRGEWESRRGSLSEYGFATDVTPPMLMAIAAMAGEVCSDLIDKEGASGAQRQIFEGFSLSGSTNSTEIQNAIQRLALSCWHRRASSDEVNEISTMIADNASGVSNDGRISGLMLCTAMLGSYSSIEM